MIEIKNRYTGEVIFTYEAHLSEANLHGAHLSEANLREANFTEAYLREANFTGANLREANFTGANLREANFTGANFNGADFTEADLTGATLLGHKVTKAPLQISGLTWPVLITEQVMAIGCQTHTHEQWAAFPDKEISNMHSHALKFWKEHGPILLQLCRVHAK